MRPQRLNQTRELPQALASPNELAEKLTRRLPEG